MSETEKPKTPRKPRVKKSPEERLEAAKADLRRIYQKRREETRKMVG
jgi:hypothetical protein